MEIRSEAAIDAAQVREGKFLRSEPETVIVEANASGRVAIELPWEVGRLEYGVERPGFAPVQLWNGAITPLSPFTLQLAPAWSVGGVVVDSQGKPIEGARIRPIRADFNRFETVDTRFGQHCRTDAEGKWHYASVPTSQTNSKSRSTIPCSPPSGERFRGATSAWTAARAAARIVLQPGLTVTGKLAMIGSRFRRFDSDPSAACAVRSRQRRRTASTGCGVAKGVFWPSSRRPKAGDRGARALDWPRRRSRSIFGSSRAASCEFASSMSMAIPAL